MHRELRKLLPSATGFSEFAIAVMADIRGFTAFSTRQDSSGVAEFVKRVYIKVMDEYFPQARFFKPTGDGLLIIVRYSGDNLGEVAKGTVEACLKLVTDFPSLCADDPMVNFDVPHNLGIGLSRGAVCGLLSRAKILDYSGRPLNLAARLADLARPSGIVFDEGFRLDLLTAPISEQFEKESVYVRGVAESQPIIVYYTKASTVIPARSMQPIREPEWRVHEQEHTLKEIKTIGGHFLMLLPSRAAHAGKISIEVRYPGVRKGRSVKGISGYHLFKQFQYSVDAGEPRLYIDYAALASFLQTQGVRDAFKVKIAVKYPEA
jgi:class 3 adenylate cyclase